MNTTKSMALIEAFADGLIPPDNLTVDTWADNYRVLPSTSSSESGPWRTSRFPFLREIMYELSDESPRETIGVMKGAQLGFTELAINWMGYTIDHSPAPFMYVQKTLDAVEKFSKQRLAPSIEECPVLRAKLTPDKSRDSGSTIRLKNFPGGIIILGGANSAASLRSLPIQRLCLDEEDSYEGDIEEEGSPSELAIARTRNFPRRKIYRVSTPTVRETSKIEPLFEEGDQRRYYVPCPYCNHFQTITWSSIVYDDEDPKTARMVCSKCKKDIGEKHKTYMLEHGKWIAEKPGREIATFHISSLYSPAGFYSWAAAAKDWISANKEMDKAKLKVFINTVLGETWSETSKTIQTAGLYSHKNDYGAEVPEGVLVLTAGVDVQEERIEVEVLGHGRLQETWSIDYVVFMGDTERAFVWEQLDSYLQKTWRHRSGADLNIAITAVDSGFRAKVVYAFCKPREYMRVFPVKGRYGWGQGTLGRPKRRNEEGVMLFIAYVDEIKSKIYSQLCIDNPGPGYCHFPDTGTYNADYFRMLTAERLVPKRVRGQRTLQWELPGGKRNEALDCRCYNLVAIQILNPNMELLSNRGPLVIRNQKKSGKRKIKTLSKGV